MYLYNRALQAFWVAVKRAHQLCFVCVFNREMFAGMWFLIDLKRQIRTVYLYAPCRTIFSPLYTSALCAVRSQKPNRP